MENKTILLSFLLELTVSINNNKLSNDQLKHIGEFLMEYKLQDYLQCNKKCDKDILKFLFIGFYISTIYV